MASSARTAVQDGVTQASDANSGKPAHLTPDLIDAECQQLLHLERCP